MIGRREFWQSSAAVLALPAMRPNVDPDDLAGRLARLVFLDDTASLAACSLQVPAALARAIAARRELFLAGLALQPAPSGDPAAALAIRAGQVALQAYEPLEPSTSEARLRWDARLLRELAAREGLAPQAVAPAAELADLFETLSRRVLIAIHTYIPDGDDVEGWMERLIRLHQAAHAYWKALGAAYAAASSARDERFDASEPVIRAAAALHHGPLDSSAVRRALSAEPRCAYARALAKAHQELSAL